MGLNVCMYECMYAHAATEVPNVALEPPPPTFQANGERAMFRSLPLPHYIRLHLPHYY